MLIDATEKPLYVDYVNPYNRRHIVATLIHYECDDQTYDRVNLSLRRQGRLNRVAIPNALQKNSSHAVVAQDLT